jgi:hypothetical protein
MDSLSQNLTYSGLLEGLPDRGMNDSLIQNAIAVDKRTNWKVHLIEPARRNYLDVPNDMVARSHIAGRPPEFLPMVCCRATLNDTSPVRGSDADCSFLDVVWFQSEFALPIDADVLRQLQGLDWDKLASDGFW